MCDIEKKIVEHCVVADVGGFLQTNSGVKRTSRFSFSYMMPALDAIANGAVGVVPQLHVRYTPTAEKDGQALVYVENGSTVYTVSFLLEASEVSRLTTCEALGQMEPPALLDRGERLRRVEAAIDTLALMLENMLFGAKRTRSLPHWRVLSLVAAVSWGVAPFIVSPGHDKGYLEETVSRARSLEKVYGNSGSKENGGEGPRFIEILYYPGSELGDGVEGAKGYNTVSGLLAEAKRLVKEKLEKG